MKRTLFLGLATTALVLGAGVAAGYSLSTAPIEAKAGSATYTCGFEADEGFTAGTNYQDTVTSGPVGTQWKMYGTPTTNSKINGAQSVGLRYYSTSNLATQPIYLAMGFDLPGVTTVSYVAKAATTNGAAIKIDTQYSTDGGSTWTNVETGKSLTSSAASYNFKVAEKADTSKSYRIRFNVNSSSTKPSSKNAQLTIDDISISYETAGAIALNSVSAENVNLKVGVSSKIVLSFDPASADNKDVTYEVTSGTDVASVDAEGNVTGLKAGTATVTIKPSDTNAAATTCTVTVEDHPEVEEVVVGKKYAIYGLGEGNAELSGISGTLGSAAAFTGEIPSCNYPFTVVAGAVKNTVAFYDNATKKYLEYSGTDNELHEIDSITMASSWTVATETIEENDILAVRNALNNSRVLSYNYNKGNPRFACYGNTSQTMVKFLEIAEVALTDFTIDETLEVRKGLTATIGVEYDPANATDKSLTWTSSDETVATVDSDGVVTGVELGTAVIKASKTIGGTEVERSCTVTVTKTLTHAGTLDDPYDVADAKILGDHPTVGNVENVYVKGFFTKFYTNSPTTSDCSIWIGDELTQTSAATGAFEFYKIAGLDENSLAALKIGATIVGKGNIKKYKTTYELDQGCTIEYNSYAEALGFGGDFINDLATICAVTKDSASGEAPASLKTAWGTLATAYGNLSEVEQAHIISATADEAGDNVEKAAALYDYAVAKYTDLDKFITTRVSSLGNFSNNRVSNDHNNAAWIIVAVLGVSAIVAGSVVIIAKKRRAE